VLKENYAECAFTVFPSVEEGFGLPIAESLWYGKPCLCANFGPMAEIAEGGGCWTVDMRSPEALRNGLLTLVSDPHLRKSLLQQVNERQFSRWRDYASAVETSLLGLNAPAAVLSKVFYLVDHTCTFGLNTGIQRVVRGLAAALIREGVQLIPAKWNLDKTNLESPSSAELNNFSKWNGPPATGFTVWENPGKSKNSWVLMPELTSHYEEADYQHIRKFLDSKSLRACSIFYDTIPWKLRDLYPPSATKGHRLYMAGLNLFELILPISSYSRDQLEKFYLGEPQPTTGLQRRLIVCPLPGEFKETARSLQVKSRHTDPVEILSVGTLEPRKNHLTLVRAFLQACSTSPRLLRLTLAGGAPFPDIAREVKRLVAEYPAQLCWVESPSDSILKELYESCDFTVYPSVEEGFGLPILESLWHARPCICMSKGAMAEVASGGGCLTVDTRQTGELAAAIVELSQNEVLREQLCEEAITRPFRTWDDYASDCALYMAQERVLSSSKELYSHLETAEQDSSLCMPNLSERPILSVCISTYNRANWLKLSLAVLAKESSNLLDRIELFVCDNASTDATFDVVAPYVAQGSVRYHRNSKNVGMLGNLRSTAQEARGRYIWILGDDDIVKPGAIANVVSALDQNSKLAMVYLNYAYTRDESPTEPDHLPAFFESATPVVLAGSNRLAPIKELVVMNENFFTAIYCIVFERSHALMAYSQYTEGEPFSSLLTCVPTTSHVLTKMMELNGCWLAEPQLVINLNVSWSQHAWRWILQRFPEIHDLAETYHAQSQDVDRWRDNYMPHIEHYLNETFLNINTDRKFQIEKLLLSIKHTEKFKIHKKGITEVYRKAYELQHSLATEHPDSLFMHNQI
jgi:glycosyltransferase involved in cell wall biosynthesis